MFQHPSNYITIWKSLKCLYLSQISMDLYSVKKHLNATVLPQLLSTHLTSSFNINRKFQIWPCTFPLCNAHMAEILACQHDAK